MNTAIGVIKGGSDVQSLTLRVQASKAVINKRLMKGPIILSWKVLERLTYYDR